MVIDIRQIAARDQLPGQKDYKRLLARMAIATSSLQGYEAGNVLDFDENTRWKSKGRDEELTISLADEHPQIKRIDIEWDPDLPRNGTAEIDAGDGIKTLDLDGSLFTIVEATGDFELVGNDDEIIIKCHGNKDNDLNGIATVAVYGYDD